MRQLRACRSIGVLFLIMIAYGRSVAGVAEIASPDGRIHVAFDVKEFEGTANCPVYSVSYRGRIVVAESRLGFELADGHFGAGVTPTVLSSDSHNGIWEPVYGERSTIRNSYNEIGIKLQETDTPHRALNVVFRAYDGGIAFRYAILEQPALNAMTIAKEVTEFRFPADYKAWATYSAQGKYETVAISQIKRGCERPLTLQAADDVYLAVAEAALVDYARMKLSPLPNQAHSLVSDLSGPVESELPLTTPWRVVMIAESPGALLENNDIILNLNAPCALGDTSWIKPGKVIREVTLTTTGGKACVDFAVAHNLQYVEFDAGWYGPEYSDESDATTVTVDPKRSKGPLDLQEVIRYADERGIGIIVYVNRRALERQIDEILPLYQRWGIKGVKYGFVNVGSQKWTSWLHEAIRKAADHQLMVDVHDEYRPTGYSRTYPNFMTQEGIRGDEERQPNTMSLTTLFTRMLAGAADNTICYYNERVDQQSTHAYQLAKAVCFYSPWQFLFWYDRPSASPKKIGGAGGSETGIGTEPEIEFFAQCPTVWDDSKVLRGQIGRYAIIARRSGPDWFIGYMNSGQARAFEVPLDFLDAGEEYVADIYSDDPAVATRTHVRIDRFAVDRGTILKMSASAQGGQAIHIAPSAPGDDYPKYR